MTAYIKSFYCFGNIASHINEKIAYHNLKCDQFYAILYEVLSGLYASHDGAYVHCRKYGFGELSEWSIVRHSKCRVLYRTPGSNPGLSAKIKASNRKNGCWLFICCTLSSVRPQAGG